MKIRSYAVVAALIATGAFSAVSAPAQAAATDPVTNLTATQSQVGHSDQISANWTPNDTATTYRMYISDQANGSTQLEYQDVTGNATSITTTSLAAGSTYYVAVKSLDVGASVATFQFTALALDSTGPTGTYKLNRTSGYLTLDFMNALPPFTPTADFSISQLVAPADNTTPTPGITRAVLAGDGTTAKPWTQVRPFVLKYAKAGAFTPHVLLTDQFGNTTDIALPVVHVLSDHTAPRVRITLPKVRPNGISSWRTIRGTAVDSGSGVQAALAFVVQKRGSIWYAYDFGKKKWLKGYASLTKTVNRTNAEPAGMSLSGTHWHTPAIKGLRSGPLHVEAVAFDNAFNLGQAPKVNRTLH